MEIKVLGTGCKKCNTLEKLVEEVLNELDVDAKIEKVTEIKEIAKTGVMLTPGLVIDGKVKSSGKLPSKNEIGEMITTALAEK